MASPFGSITAGAGFLARFATLTAERKTEAETFADGEIRDTFRGWDVAAWIGADVPPKVAELWLQLAAGRYLQLEIASVDFSDSTNRGDALIKDARRQSRQVVNDGGPLDKRGQLVVRPTMPDEVSGGMFVDIVS